MLDLRDPLTQYVFRAAALEDEIRAHLVAVRRGGDGADHESRYQNIISRVIPDLRRLNSEHFGASQGISDSLDALETAITLNDLDLSWKLFFKLAEAPGENFGTWAI